ncbi:zinc-binding dehydrogenase [Granulicella mallensis]|uniref:NADPH2:quinone reductase n=1 Tax=Granulicella mallensis TaxID=940614 RepID=A0A7W7ZU05_9BACT|nr:zinc-binding dehydrogenase [Granulicella mallensis]MBB5066066.1 NADPH2:quinone reductase [Granulicella mallensis]
MLRLKTMQKGNPLKAIFFEKFGTRDVLQFGDRPEPAPQQKELLIEVQRSSVNFVDIRERQGTYNRPETHVGGIELPHISGLQAVGTVIAAGSKEDTAWIGKKVVAYTPKGGGYAQKVVAETGFCVEIPESANADLFAALPNQGLTAYLLLTASTQIQPGESVLVQGASGGVGSLAVQIAKILGAGTVLGTASTSEKLDFIRSLGADDAIDYTREDWTKRVLENTSGRGVDVILESIGGDIFEQNFECLAPFGRHIIFGSTRGPGQPFAPRRLMQKSQTMTGFYLPVFLAKLELIRAGMEFLVKATLEEKLRPSIARILPLSQTAEAHRLLEDREVQGTILLDTK